MTRLLLATAFAVGLLLTDTVLSPCDALVNYTPRKAPARRSRNNSNRRDNDSNRDNNNFNNFNNGENNNESRPRRTPFSSPLVTTIESPAPYIPSSTPSPNDVSINCKHFGTCPGCSTNEHLTRTPIINSASLFFSSPSIQQHRLHDRHTQTNGEFFRTVIPSFPSQWRTQAKLAAAPRSTWANSGCVFGLYQRGTHDVLEIPDCKVHHPLINKAIEALTKATETVRTPGFNNDNGEGALRYVQLQVERNTNKVALTLVWNSDELKGTQPGLSRLTKELKRKEPELWNSIWVHCNAGAGNNIFARGEGRWHRVDGLEFVRENLPSGRKGQRDGLLYFNPMVFRQGNLDGFEAIARHVAEVVPSNSRVCELYAGVGLLGLTTLNYLHHESQQGLIWLRCSDENPANVRCFDRSVSSMPTEVTGRPPREFVKKIKGKKNKKGNRNIKRNNSNSMEDMFNEILDTNNNQQNTNQPKVTYMVASATDALYKGQAIGADVLIVDPPRKGLDEEVLSQLCKPHNPNQDPVEDIQLLYQPSHTVNLVNEVHTIVYVSCGFDALARDCDRLLSSSAGWKIESATGYVLFPGSNHLETLVVFKRAARRQ